MSVSKNNNKTKWYVGGLHFECMQCGACCAGPDEGCIWVTKAEIELIAKYLDEPVEQLWGKYLKHIGRRATIIEELISRDCIFLTGADGQRSCSIYAVRPNQCRTWPFWPDNLTTPNDWNRAAMKCPGINRGRLYGFEEIERLKEQKTWWADADKQQNSRCGR